jgi:hypothetical protein
MGGGEGKGGTGERGGRRRAKLTCCAPSFIIAILIGSWCSLTVPRSLSVMLKEESPSIKRTILSGWATCGGERERRGVRVREETLSINRTIGGAG